MFGRLDDIRSMAQDDPRVLQEREHDGWTIAHWAARRGYMNLMNFICERSPALLNAKALNGATPAHFAASYGHDSILDLMAEREPASLMHQDKEGNSPAHDATRHHRMQCLKLLVERSPSLIYGSNARGKRPIDLAERDELRTYLKDAEKASMVPAVQLQNLTREARVLNAQNAVLALYCKHYWSHPAPRGIACCLSHA
jgi:ankyrin repeat protein